MTNAQLLELIANGENSGVEFERDDLRPEQIAQEIVALANLQGGRVLLGVEDDGAITGIQRVRLERWVMDTVFGRCVHPMIQPFYEEIRIDERWRVAVITVTEGTTKPYVVRHRGQEQVFVRMGSTSQLASREQRMRLFSAGGMLYVESLPVSGSGLRDLSKERLADYLTAVLRLTDLPASDAALCERLCDLGFMVENEGRPAVCSVAGLVLFGYRPRRLLRQAGVRWMAFKGDDKAYDALDDQVIDGPLVARSRELPGGGREIVERGLIERLADAMRPFVSEEGGEVIVPLLRDRNGVAPEFDANEDHLRLTMRRGARGGGFR